MMERKLMKNRSIPVLFWPVYDAAIALLHHKSGLVRINSFQFQLLTQHRTFQADREKRPSLAISDLGLKGGNEGAKIVDLRSSSPGLLTLVCLSKADRLKTTQFRSLELIGCKMKAASREAPQ